MEGIYAESALYGSKNECARTDTVFLPISEVCNGTVSLNKCWRKKNKNVIHKRKYPQIQRANSVLF